MDHVLSGVLKGRTVVLVTHNKTSLTFCDRIFLMEHGGLRELPKDSDLDAVIVDEGSNSTIEDRHIRLSFSSSESIHDFEEEEGPAFDVLGGASAVTEGLGHRELAEDNGIPPQKTSQADNVWVNFL